MPRRRAASLGKLKQGAWIAASAVNFARLYALPTLDNPMPAEIRLEPVW